MNITKTFQAKLLTTFDCPPSSMPHYYVKMPNSFGTTINNHVEDQLLVDLDDVIPELQNLIGSNQSPRSWIGSLVINACNTNKER